MNIISHSISGRNPTPEQANFTCTHEEISRYAGCLSIGSKTNYCRLTKNFYYKIVKYHRKQISLEQIGFSPKNAALFLKIVKNIDIVFGSNKEEIPEDLLSFRDTTSYKLRKHIFKFAYPRMESFEVFTMTIVPLKMRALSYLFQDNSWITPRRSLHERILMTQLETAKMLSHRLPHIIALRGNTAVGKSTKMLEVLARLLNSSISIQESLSILKDCLSIEEYTQFEEETKQCIKQESDRLKKQKAAACLAIHMKKGGLNPDDFKQQIQDIRKKDKALNFQVHREGSMLFNKVLKDFIESKLLNYVLDTRLADLEVFEKNVVNPARETNRSALLFDFDCELITSLNRVLIRNPYQDPCPPLEEIVKGFVKIREYRSAIIKKVNEEKCIKEYQLFCSTKQVLVAEKRDGKVVILNQDIYDHVTKKPVDTEIENTLNRLITPEYVQEAIDRGDIRESSRAQLKQWIENPPLTIRQAVELRILDNRSRSIKEYNSHERSY